MFVLEDVSFAYDPEEAPKELALKRVSLHIKKGEWWSIIGANGSGKSTLARHLNGLLTPGSGKVLVDGMDTAAFENLAAIRRQVGIVFQNPDNQIIGNSVEEDVAFGPENIGVDPVEIRARIGASLEKVGLPGFETKDPNQLSGGQKQRVAIAGALAMNPAALVIDEATAMLDPQGCQEVFAVLRQLHQKGMTIVMITHHMHEVVFSDQVAVMAGGDLMATGAPKEIFAQTENLKRWSIELPMINRIGEQLLADGIAEYCPDLRDKVAAVMSVAEMAGLLLGK